MRVCPTCARFGQEVAAPGSAAPWPAARAEPGLPGEAPAPRPAPRRPRDILEASEVELVEDFGKRIREARQRKGFTQEELGRRLAERQSVLSKIEAGQQRPSDALARRLERELGIRLFERVAAEAPERPAGAARGVTLEDLVGGRLERE